jgi:hypothetical protein
MESATNAVLEFDEFWVHACSWVPLLWLTAWLER